MTIVAVEHHDGAYHAWFRAGVRHRTLVHLDAHHDMQWLADPRDTTIGNFIARALAEGMLDGVYWVVPDGTRTRAGMRAVRRHLRALQRTYPKSGPVSYRDGRFHTQLLDKVVVVCTLDNLPPVDRPLLDVDVDYLIMPSVSYSEDRHGALPWCWPCDLVHRLAAAGISSDLITIAYSVEGGYTPLQWKYLGDELSARLSGGKSADAVASAMQLISEGAMLASRGDGIAAERRFLDAAAASTHAAPWYWLSIVAAPGDRASARNHFEHAVAIDPSYYTAYDGGGFWHYWHARHDQAERAFDEVLTRDPRHEFALTGLALVAAHRKQWEKAEHFARAALGRNGTLVDAHRVLGAALAAGGRHRAALAAYDTSLRLVLAGRTPFRRPLSTDGGGGTPEDPGHASTYERIGEIHMALGESSKAIDAFRFAIATGNARTATRARAAALCLKSGDWRGAFRLARRPRQSPEAADRLALERGAPRNVQ